MRFNWKAASLCIFTCFCVCLKIAASAEEPCKVEILGPNPKFVAYGAPGVLNCTTTCNTTLQWEIDLQRLMLNSGNRSSSLAFNMTQWFSKPECFVITSEVVQRTNTTIIAYQPPEDVSIDLVPVMEVGKSYNLTCEVLNVAPKRYLTILIQKGNEILHKETYADDLTEGSTNVTVSHTITAQRRDHGAEYTCIAQLNLTHGGGFFEDSNYNYVRVYALPEDLKIQIPELIEEGAEVKVTCEVVHPFPVGDVNITMSFNEKELSITKTQRNDMLTAEAVVPTAEPGRHLLHCTASFAFGGIPKTTQKYTFIYSFPDPVLHIPTMTADTNVKITCELGQTVPTGVTLTIRSNTTLMTCENPPDMLCIYELRPQKQHNGMEISCDADLREVHKNKTTSEILNVVYGPEFSDVLCPSIQKLIEGNQSKCACKADGNPPPIIKCTTDESADTLQNVRRNNAGSYNCTATNDHSTKTKVVTITVEYKPNVTLDMEAPEKLKKGDNVTLSCQADGLPTPQLSWITPEATNLIYSDDNSTITVLRAGPQNTGTYRCKAKNRHGEDSRQKDINVADHFPLILGLVLGSVAITVCTAAAVGYYLYNRAQKIRKYRLQNPKQPTKMENLIPSETKMSSI